MRSELEMKGRFYQARVGRERIHGGGKSDRITIEFISFSNTLEQEKFFLASVL